MTPNIRILAIDLFERDIPFTHPFRFGAVTVEGASQAYVRVRAEVDGREVIGASAELMVPKWFDKNPHKSADQTADDLRLSLYLAAQAYRGASGTAFAIHAERHDAHIAACAEPGLPGLAAAFGNAEIDKAVLDALFRASGVGSWEGFSRNLAGLDARLTPDLDATSITDFLASRAPLNSVAIRHTVGFLDDPTSIPATISTTGCRFLKLKLSGNPEADRVRLAAIAAVLPTSVEGVSVDANEQYDPALLPELRAILDHASLADLHCRLLYVEQPTARDSIDLGAFSKNFACVLDEGDDSYAAFPRAIAAGWRGVSSKSCKGTYKALLNAIRAQRAGLVMTAEDLTAQPGLALQQDTALVSFLGLAHMERNGHCYADGFADAGEAAIFASAHPELYQGRHLRIQNGAVPTHRLGSAVGHGSAVHPDWSAMKPIVRPQLFVPNSAGRRA